MLPLSHLSFVLLVRIGNLSQPLAKAIKMLPLLSSLVCLAVVALAQFPPEPENVTVLKSKFGDGVTISFKEVRTTMIETLRGLVTDDEISLASVKPHQG
jgi:hypothetical protein